MRYATFTQLQKGGHITTISVIIPVLHEQERINGLLGHLKSQGETVPEIIVVDGCPEGSTLSVISMPEVICLTAPTGRGNQIAAGAAVAGGSVILMLHADTLLPDNAFNSIRTAIDQGADWGAFRLGIDDPGPAYRIIERTVDIRCNLFTLPYGDQALFVTRHALDFIGGIPAIPIMEDVALCRRLDASGFCFQLLPARVQTSARRWQKDGIFLRTLGNWRLLLRYLAGTDPAGLAQKY